MTDGAPIRIQLRRTKGWHLPSHARSVARPTRYGNPYRLDEYRADYPDADTRQLAAMTVSDFRGNVERRWDDHGEGRPYPSVEEIRADLAGADLACWCPPGQPCHADVLLEIANAEGARP